MSLLPFRKAEAGPPPGALAPLLAPFLAGASIEVMPRTAAAVPDFRALLAPGTRVYVAHIDGTPIADMVATARRLRDEGFEPMPHIPARLIGARAELADWIAAYRAEAGVREALLLGGGLPAPRGAFDNSMQLLETGLFDGFRRLHVAGHPEGNRDIDPDGSDRAVMAALRWKQAFSERTDATMAIATQFCFEAAPVIDWAGRLAAEGIALPVHIGVAGPAKLQTLLKFAIACGVGPSLRVLQRRARDVTRLMLPFEPDAMLAELARHRAAHPGFGIEAVHIFPLGGIKTATDWLSSRGATSQVG
ncbi:methylenetetrahydrofolate reductase [Frigidibacter sp. MR17.24]|uniref:methylenetetrahydrofolate reductase n=1 Tax=Frigidibacter sp. MR17.24 TaxID=3127345 RepID=UPI003012BA69